MEKLLVIVEDKAAFSKTDEAKLASYLEKVAILGIRRYQQGCLSAIFKGANNRLINLLL